MVWLHIHSPVVKSFFPFCNFVMMHLYAPYMYLNFKASVLIYIEDAFDTKLWSTILWLTYFIDYAAQ